jgi:hypothetical protein
MPDPVAWVMIERGWQVVTPDGEELGHVEEVRGDTEADIFDGLEVRKSLLTGTEYVPSERVSDIREGIVTVRA